MEFYDTISHRHSVRRFTDEKIPGAQITKILKAALTAPSSKNARSSSFMVTENPDLLLKISEMRDMGSSLIKGAACAILVMGDETVTDLWEVNSSISASYVQLAAEALGLGNCWVQVSGRTRMVKDPSSGDCEEYLRSFLPVPAGRRILCVIALGHSAEPPKHREEEIINDNNVILLK